MKNTFVAVQKNGDGDITSFKDSQGKVYNYQEAIQAVDNGEVLGANTFKGKDGEKYIRGNADGDPSNNLDNMETF